MNAILTAHILLVQDRDVLLVRHEDGAGHLTGVYGIPGGRISDGESSEDTAIRELFEETGLRVKKEDLREYESNEYSAEIKRKSGEAKHYTMKVFYAVKFTGELDSSEETTPEWIKVEGLNKYKLLPNVERAVKDVINRI